MRPTTAKSRSTKGDWIAHGELIQPQISREVRILSKVAVFGTAQHPAACVGLLPG
jgi:hypothetical protein